MSINLSMCVSVYGDTISLMTWFIFSLLSIFALATAELTQQHLLNKKDAVSPRTSAVFTFLIPMMLVAPIVLLTNLRASLLDVFTTIIIVKILLVTLVASVATIFYFKSFQVKNISLSTIFISGSVLISTTLGIIIFNESTSVLKLLGIFMVLVAIVSVNYKNPILEKNHWYGLLAGLLFGLGYAIDKSVIVSSNIHPLIFMFWAFPVMAFYIFISNPLEVINTIKKTKISFLKPIILSGSAYTLYNIFTFSAYKHGGEVGRVDAINNSQVFLIILFEYILLSHKKSLIRKLVTASIAFSGVLVLGLVN